MSVYGACWSDTDLMQIDVTMGLVGVTQICAIRSVIMGRFVVTLIFASK
jgi:hypothetical protein